MSEARELLDALREGVLVYDLDGQLVDHNAQARALLGLDDEGLARLAIPGEGEGESHPIPPLPRLWQALVEGERKRSDFRVEGAVLEVHGRRVSVGGEARVLVELHDITGHKRTERALIDSKKQLEKGVHVRTRELQAKLRLIEQQQQELRALSTPVIQVWEGVLVLPLIGGVDRDRAMQITERLLDTIMRTSSHHVIIDLTGVPEIDEEASAALLRTVQAVGLLGGVSSFTGISPAVAQSFVHAGAEWTRSARIFADLQAALRAALRRG